MYLVVGLGNPGPQYALTRHNVGFLCVDLLVEGLGVKSWNQEHKAWMIKLKIDNTPVIFAKPQTFMNKSGESIQALMNFYKIPLENLLVVYDEIDLPYATMKFNKNRGHNGHNGIRNISELLGSNDFARLRLGVGRPPHPEMKVADYVLQKFAPEEQKQMPEFLNKAGDAIECFLLEGLGKASTLFNS